MKYKILWGLLALVFTGCQPDAEITIDQQYMDSFHQIQQDLLQRRHNYLKLAGLLPVEEETHTLGTNGDSANWVIEAKEYPDIIGTFQFRSDSIIFTGNPDLSITLEDDSVIQVVNLQLDENGNSPKLVSGQLSWMIITRGIDKLYLRVWDEKNSAVQQFTPPESYPLNADMIFDGQFQYYSEPKSTVVDSKLGFDQPTVFVGTFSFEHLDQLYTLEVGQNGFTMIADPTNGHETYGGGRYMYLTLPKQDSTIRMDLNQLYNPPCTFSEYTTCLIPPPQNNLPFDVLAGELFKDDH